MRDGRRWCACTLHFTEQLFRAMKPECACAPKCLPAGRLQRTGAAFRHAGVRLIPRRLYQSFRDDLLPNGGEFRAVLKGDHRRAFPARHTKAVLCALWVELTANDSIILDFDAPHLRLVSKI